MRKLIQSTAVVLALTGAVGCASASKGYVQADTAVADNVIAFKAAKDARCDAGEIPASACLAVSKAFVPFLDAYLAVNRAVSAEAPIAEIDVAIKDLRAAAVDLQAALNEVAADKRKLLLDLLEAALRRYVK